jgi:hypothetical protein
MEIYKFPHKNITFQEGYTIVQVSNGVALIDENDPLQVALALDFGGVKVVKKQPVKRGKT